MLGNESMSTLSGEPERESSKPVRNYLVVDKHTTIVVADGIRTRREARLIKAKYEGKHVAVNKRPMPSRYYVETDIDNPNGPGLYIH